MDTRYRRDAWEMHSGCVERCAACGRDVFEMRVRCIRDALEKRVAFKRNARGCKIMCGRPSEILTRSYRDGRGISGIPVRRV
eukprot:1582888-Pleurochrysis_carterae.AAC.1